MNEQPSPLGRMDDERRSSSPKRKKVRQKYAPKACVSCRRSKLKCTGENPCQRCIDNGKRCFYSEDETAAQTLQNLSRPTPAQPPSLANGNRRNTGPRRASMERRASDASVLAMSMEARMARIETMMEALMHDRGMTTTPTRGMVREESGSDGFRSETAFALPLLDPIHPALAHMGQQSDMEQPSDVAYDSPDWRTMVNSNNAEPPITLVLDGRPLPFPPLVEYRRYMTSFFDDIHLRHPCIEEREFRTSGERLLAGGAIQTSDVVFLALNYTIFACCSILSETERHVSNVRPEGWHWYQLADNLVNKNTLLGSPINLRLIQLLLFQALYLTFIDLPGPAYFTIGLASRLVLQSGLHQEHHLSFLDPEQLYIHVCLFWNVFITDRSISLSCRRPYSIREKEINMEPPMNVYNKVLLHRQALSQTDPRHYINIYMNYTTLLAHRAGHIWDTIVAAQSPNSSLDRESMATIDSQIGHFLANELPTMHIPLLQDRLLNAYNKTAMILSNNNITLLLRHRVMTSLQYDGKCAHEFGSIALDTMCRMRTYFNSGHGVGSLNHPSFRQHMISSLAGALLAFCALLVRDLSSPDLDLQHNHHAYIKGFQDAAAMLGTFKKFGYGKRVFDDFIPLLNTVGIVVQNWLSFTPDQHAQGGFDLVKAFVPSNIAELFPYRAVTPSLHAPTPSAGESFPEHTVSGAWATVDFTKSSTGVLWL